MTKEEKATRVKDIELSDLYRLVEKSLLKETDSDQPHYIEVGKAQNFIQEYSDQQVEIVKEEIRQMLIDEDYEMLAEKI